MELDGRTVVLLSCELLEVEAAKVKLALDLW